MVKSGRWLALAFLLTGCLEQELDVLNSTEAMRLLDAGTGKDWISEGAAFELQFRGTTTKRFLLMDANGDSISHGTWSLSEDVRGNFTDSLLLDLTAVSPANPLAAVNVVQFLTAQIFILNTEAQQLEFSAIAE